MSPEAVAAATEVEVPSGPPSKKAKGAEAMAVMALSAETNRKEAAKALDHDVALALNTFQIASLPATVPELNQAKAEAIAWPRVVAEEGESSTTPLGVTVQDVERAYKVLRKAMMTRVLWPEDPQPA